MAGLHALGVVIGDFNDLNVLVKDEQAYLIDADSFQFGGFLCRVFPERFVDPLSCDPQERRPLLCKPFSTDSDWHAFAVMVMQTLLSVGPYGGVYRPKSTSARVPEYARPLRRITVFHPEVLYPKPAAPYVRDVFRSMGIEDRWILTPGKDAADIRKAFLLFSPSAVRASQGGASFSRAAVGGFGSP